MELGERSSPMNRLGIFLVVIAGVAVNVQAHTVECDGAESTGTGAVTCDPTPRDYAYGAM